MGCDIHLFVEARLRLDKDGNKYWHRIRRQLLLNDIFDTQRIIENDWYHGRNYNLFAMLADVRNGTHGYFEPLAAPRGLPRDVSEEIQKESDSWGVDGHSHSWFTLRELQDEKYWAKTATMKNFVSQQQADAYHERGEKPTAYAAWSSLGVELEWEETYADQAGSFLTQLVPTLQSAKEWELGIMLHRPQAPEDRLTEDDIRIVFWFDN